MGAGAETEAGVRVGAVPEVPKAIITIGLLLQLWTSFKDPADTKAILDGHFQSCTIPEDGYGEIAYDHYVNGKQLWSFHLGPFDDWALFKGTEPDGDDHDSPLNLLAAHHALSLPTINGARQWSVPSLKLWISVVQGGGSRDQCMGWYVRVERKP